MNETRFTLSSRVRTFNLLPAPLYTLAGKDPEFDAKVEAIRSMHRQALTA